RRLERQLVRRRNLRGPSGDQLVGRHPIERVIDLHRRKARRVVRQHLRRGEIGGIEAALPLGIVVTGSTDPDHGKLVYMSRFRVFVFSWLSCVALLMRGCAKDEPQQTYTLHGQVLSVEAPRKQLTI